MTYGDKMWAKLSHLADMAELTFDKEKEEEEEGRVSEKPKLKSHMNTLSDDIKWMWCSEASTSSLTGQQKLAQYRNKDSSKSLKIFKLNRMLLLDTSSKTSQRKLNPISKKAKVVVAFSWIGKETPEWVVQLMTDMKGTELKLIFEKRLFETDVNPSESRLSMPYNSLIHKDFMTATESKIIEDDINKKKKNGMGTILVDPKKKKWGMILKRWEMKKKTGKGSWNYALTCGWNDVVEANGFKESQNISIWSFRWNRLLCFAIVTPHHGTE